MVHFDRIGPPVTPSEVPAATSGQKKHAASTAHSDARLHPLRRCCVARGSDLGAHPRSPPRINRRLVTRVQPLNGEVLNLAGPVTSTKDTQRAASKFARCLSNVTNVLKKPFSTFNLACLRTRRPIESFEVTLLAARRDTHDKSDNDESHCREDFGRILDTRKEPGELHHDMPP